MALFGIDRSPELPLTLAEHRELSRELRSTKARLRELRKLIAGIYGSNNRAVFEFAKAIESMERLSTDMKEQATRDFPGSSVDHLYS